MILEVVCVMRVSLARLVTESMVKKHVEQIDSGFCFHTCNLFYVKLSRWDPFISSSCSVTIGVKP